MAKSGEYFWIAFQGDHTKVFVENDKPTVDDLKRATVAHCRLPCSLLALHIKDQSGQKLRSFDQLPKTTDYKSALSVDVYGSQRSSISVLSLLFADPPNPYQTAAPSTTQGPPPTAQSTPSSHPVPVPSNAVTSNAVPSTAPFSVTSPAPPSKTSTPALPKWQQFVLEATGLKLDCSQLSTASLSYQLPKTKEGLACKEVVRLIAGLVLP
jgi:hypothetical protein